MWDWQEVSAWAVTGNPPAAFGGVQAAMMGLRHDWVGAVCLLLCRFFHYCCYCLSVFLHCCVKLFFSQPTGFAFVFCFSSLSHWEWGKGEWVEPVFSCWLGLWAGAKLWQWLRSCLCKPQIKWLCTKHSFLYIKQKFLFDCGKKRSPAMFPAFTEQKAEVTLLLVCRAIRK